LIGTTAGSVSVPTYASTAISDYSPATAKTILIGVSVSGGSIIMANSSGYGTAGSTTNPAPFYSTGGNTMWPIDLIDQNIYYANDSANTRIWANGWIDV
jgi:hypothetical protein